MNPQKKGMRPFAEVLEKAHNPSSPTGCALSSQRRPKGFTAYQRTAEKLNQGAEQAAEAGTDKYIIIMLRIKPMQGNKTGFDIFVDSFSTKMRFEADVFWVNLGV